MLKHIRVIVSLVVLMCLSIIFLDIYHWLPEGVFRHFTSIQLIPAILASLTLQGWAILVLIVLILLSLVLGRLYCSTLCPLGTVQDMLTRLSGVLRIRRRHQFTPPLNILRYVLLVLAVLFFVSGNALILHLTEPFANFGRILTSLVRPPVILLNNLLASVFRHFGIYSVIHQDIKGLSGLAVSWAVIFTGTLIVMTALRGRLFCNTLCPAGAILSLISRFSAMRVRIDETRCNSCGVCAVHCKAECIDPRQQKVDMSRCVVCFNCLSACKSGGISYTMRASRHRSVHGNSKDMPDPKRRYLLMSLVPLLLHFPWRMKSTLPGLLNPAEDENSPTTFVPEKKAAPVSPPGSQSVEHLQQYCTACHLCISACPKQVLVPAVLQYGLAGVMQPTLNYRISFCNYECVVCSQVCPTGAILPLTPEQKITIQTGIARFLKNYCVVFTDGTDCGACAEHCPTQAVRMVTYRDDLLIPEITPSICVGCGACEYACPTTPKAIEVNGHAVHQQADKPVVKLPQKVIDLDDFPF